LSDIILCNLKLQDERESETETAHAAIIMIVRSL